MKRNDRQRIRSILKRIGYYCPGCGRYKKTFSPPFGRRVCLRCQLADANGHKQGLDELMTNWEQGIMSNTDLVSRLEYLRSRYLPSKEERKDE